jgi:hypothetical protein
MSTKICLQFLRFGMLIGAITWAAAGAAQEAANRTGALPSEASAESVTGLREQVRQLQEAVVEMRSEWQRARAETAELRRDLDEVQAAIGLRNGAFKPVVAKSGIPDGPAAAGILRETSQNTLQNTSDNELQHQKQVQKQDQNNSEHTARLEEEYQLLSGMVDDQYQTKVESASKYRLRLSGIVLMNLFSNQGVVDNIDLPTLVYAHPAGDTGGSVGATLRQSEIGLETFGPVVAGAKTRADLQLDFAGGFSAVPNGTNSPLVRLRTGTMRMDWTNTSIVVGQDSIFFSPNSPTSFATLAIPALTYAGNLWAWVPQVRVEHKVAVGEESSLLFQAGILDPVSGEAPSASSYTSGANYYRQPGPGEASRQPAYGTRIAWTRNIFGQPLRLGAGGYYSRQDYGFNRNVDAWAGMTDIEIPFSSRFSFSGKFYRGRALGGLYGGIGRSVLFSGDPTLASTEVQALDSIGGWAQLKYRPANKWEFNAAFGTDNPYASDLKYFQYPQAYGDPTLARNHAGFVNMIYRPRSDLLFSAEYRRLTTYSLSDGANGAGHLNLMMGVLF